MSQQWWCVCWYMISASLRRIATHTTNLVRIFNGNFPNQRDQYFFISFPHPTPLQTESHGAALSGRDSLCCIKWEVQVKVTWGIDWLMCITHHIRCRESILHDCFALVSFWKSHGSIPRPRNCSVLKLRFGKWTVACRFELLYSLVTQTEYVTIFLFQRNKRIMNITNLKSVRQ